METGDAGVQARAKTLIAAGGQCLARAAQRLREALIVDGFEQVVERVDVEGPDRVLIEGGHENDVWCALRVQARDHIEPRHLGHLHVQKHQVGRQLADGRDRLAAVGALPDHRNVAGPLEPDPKAAAGQFLIVDQ